jgi:hypothetical protein
MNIINLTINQFKINLIPFINFIILQISLLYLIAYDNITFLISFVNIKINLIRIQLIPYNNYLNFYIYNFIIRFVLLKFNLFIFIYFKLPSLLIKIRVFYLLSIIIINLLIFLLNYYELQISTFNTISYFNLESYFKFYLFNNQLEDNFIYTIPNNQNGNYNYNDFNLSNNSSSNNNINPSNNPNPLGSESNAIVLINSNQERDNDLISNLIDNKFNDSTNDLNENTSNQSSQFRYLFRASSPDTFFNEISYDPQYDDLEFNSKVLYPYDHIWFDNMVQNRIDQYAVGSLIRAINNISDTDNLYWDIDSKQEAIHYINSKINQ